MSATSFMPDESVVAGIRKDIELYEAERASAHKQVLWRVPVFIGVPLVVAILLAFFFNSLADRNEQWSSTPHVFLYFGTLVLLLWLYTVAMKPATSLQKSFREHLLPIVFGFVKDVRYANGVTPQSFDRLPRDLVGGFDRQSFDDVVAGTYEDFPFELYEAELRTRSGKSSVTRFKGVIVAFQLASPFPGMLMATRKANQVVSFFRGLFGASVEEIECGVPEIDEVYEFRTDNVEAARPVITGRLPKALQWLAESWKEEQARVALKGEDGYLLLPISRNMFELPSVSVPLDYKVHIEPIVADMASLLATAALVRKVYGTETGEGA